MDADLNAVTRPPENFPAEVRDASARSESVEISPLALLLDRLDEQVDPLWREFRREPTTDRRNRLVERYLPLVKYHAERLWRRLPSGIHLDDLLVAGIFCLLDAIDDFDPDRGVGFEVASAPRIRGAMLDELRSMGWVERELASKDARIKGARKALRARLIRRPTEAEIAGALGLSIGDYRRLSREARALRLFRSRAGWPGGTPDAEPRRKRRPASPSGEVGDDPTKLLALLTGLSEEEVDDWKRGDFPGGEGASRIAEMDRLRTALSAIIRPSAIPRWLTSGNDALGGVTPLEMLRRGESERLWALVDALESGLPI